MNNDVLLLNIQTKRKCHKYFHENENRVYIYIYIYQIEKKYIYVCISYICITIPFLNNMNNFFNARQGTNI